MNKLKFSNSFLKNIADELASLVALELKNRDSVVVVADAASTDADTAMRYVDLTKSIKELSLSAPTLENFSIKGQIHLTIGSFEGDFNIEYPPNTNEEINAKIQAMQQQPQATNKETEK